MVFPLTVLETTSKRKYMRNYLVLAALLVSQTASALTLTIHFTDTRQKEGEIMFAIFSHEDEFPSGGTFDEGSVRTQRNQNSVTTTIELPSGEYAVSAFLDDNGNKRLDTNLIGIPTERFGFSRNPTILTGPPSFRAARIKLERDQEITIKMITLLDQ